VAICALFFASITYAGVYIEIDNDEDDCIDGWISMDVTVRVDGEEFDFNPSCDFSFSDNFITNTGLNCEVDAGMCSGFSPDGRFEVECEDGSSEEIDIECPDAN